MIKLTNPKMECIAPGCILSALSDMKLARGLCIKYHEKEIFPSMINGFGVNLKTCWFCREKSKIKKKKENEETRLYAFK